MEAGFPIPPAGEDTAWLKENMPEFKRLADEGDEEFKGLIQDVQTRDCFETVRQEAGL